MLTKKQWRKWPALMVLPLVLMGCFGGNDKKDGGNKSSSSASTSASATTAAGPTFPVKIDTIFGEVEIPKPKNGQLRVVALGSADSEAALAVGVKPVGVYDPLGYGEKNKGVGSWATSLFGDVTPTLFPRSSEGFNYEQIQALNPDVILNTRSAGDEKTYERLKQIAPTVYGPKGTRPFSIGWENQQKQVATALGLKEKGEEVVKKMKEEIKAAQDPAFKGVNAALLAKRGPSYAAVLPGDARWDILGAIGFTLEPKLKELEVIRNVYAGIPADKASAVDTGVVVFMGDAAITVEDMKNDPLVNALQVAKDGRVVYLDRELTTAMATGSTLSMPVVLQKLRTPLHEAATKARAAQ